MDELEIIDTNANNIGNYSFGGFKNIRNYIISRVISSSSYPNALWAVKRGFFLLKPSIS